MNELFSNIITGSLSMGVAVYFAKLWVGELRSRIQKVENKQATFESDYMDKIFELQEKVSEVLDTVILKFSSWEDRVNAKINSQLENTLNGIDPDQVSGGLKNTLDQWEAENKKDFDGLKATLDGVVKDIKKIDEEMKQNKGQGYAFKVAQIDAMLKKLKGSVATLEYLLKQKVERNSDMITKAYQIMIAFNKKHKRLEQRLEKFIESGTSRIKIR